MKISDKDLEPQALFDTISDSEALRSIAYSLKRLADVECDRRAEELSQKEADKVRYEMDSIYASAKLDSLRHDLAAKQPEDTVPKPHKKSTVEEIVSRALSSRKTGKG